MILAHTALGIPFVVITVTATLFSFDTTLIRAAHNLGTNPARTFFKVEQISPTILAVATLLVLFSMLLLTTLELLRRRGERLRGLSPQ